MGRIGEICACLDACALFADIGCDHGYCTRYMLENSLCDRAIIADVSEKSLSKAETLLRRYIEEGKCRSVCCDGMTQIGERADQVLIAGMGGEEIIKILKQSEIPQKFVLQPMKNAPELRKYLLENGCVITYDNIFKDGKFYFIVKGERRDAPSEEAPRKADFLSEYSQAELQFGKDSLKNPLIKEYLAAEIEKYSERFRLATVSGREKLAAKIKFLQGVISDEIR